MSPTKRTAVAASICLMVACGGGRSPDVAGVPPDATFIDLLSRTNVKIEQFQFSPDGRRIAYVSSRNGSSDIWVMNADGTGARAITDAYPEGEAEPQWSPDGQWIAYVTRHCGTGCWSEIFMTRADGSTPPINLTYGLGGPNPQWVPDGKSIVFVRYYGDNGYSQIGVLKADIPSGRPTVRYPTTNSPGNEGDPQVSPDGKWLAFTATRSERPNGPRINGIWVVPFDGGDARLVAESADTPQWSPDGSRIAFVSGSGEWRNIGVTNVATHDTKLVTNDSWDDGNPKWSPDGRSIAFVANKKWNFYLMKVPAAGGASEQLTNRAGVSGGFEGSNARGTFRWTPDGQSIVYTFMNHGLASDLWRLPAAGGTPVQLTNSMPAGLSEGGFVAPELVSYTSKGVDIPAFLFKPKQADPARKPPLLLYSHSFGGGMFINGFYPFVQYFVSHGYVVLAPQVRGSSGNGRTFARANRGDWGGLDIDDTVAGVDYLDSRGMIDRSRIVMQGGSTGGYRTIQMAVRFPNLLKAAVDLYGPTNVVSLHEFYRGTRRRAMMMESVGGDRGDPSQAPEHWRERSAAQNIDRIRTPILLLWADRDMGVPTSQADEFFRLARQRGLPIDYVPYSNESHGWYTWRPDTLKNALTRIAAHYEKYLAPARANPDK